jgi:DNA-binding response OmpR family regulator
MKESATNQSDGGSSRQHTSRRILVVEDDRDISRLNSEVLTKSGYQVDSAEDGASAWDSLQLTHYDLMVIDGEMADLSGVDLIERVHEAHIPLQILMATRTPPMWELVEHPRLRPDATLLMPYTTEEFLGKVGEILGATDGAREETTQNAEMPLRRGMDGSRL